MPHFHNLECLEDLSSAPRLGPLASVSTAPSTLHPLVPFSKAEVEGEPGEGGQNDSPVSATLVPVQHPQPAAAEGMLLCEACLALAIALYFWAGTGTFLPPPSRQRAVSPRATGILGGGCHATALLSTLMGRKSTPRESAGPARCAIWGCDHDTM